MLAKFVFVSVKRRALRFCIHCVCKIVRDHFLLKKRLYLTSLTPYTFTASPLGLRVILVPSSSHRNPASFRPALTTYGLSKLPLPRSMLSRSLQLLPHLCAPPLARPAMATFASAPPSAAAAKVLGLSPDVREGCVERGAATATSEGGGGGGGGAAHAAPLLRFTLRRFAPHALSVFRSSRPAFRSSILSRHLTRSACRRRYCFLVLIGRSRHIYNPRPLHHAG